MNNILTIIIFTFIIYNIYFIIYNIYLSLISEYFISMRFIFVESIYSLC